MRRVRSPPRAPRRRRDRRRLDQPRRLDPGQGVARDEARASGRGAARRWPTSADDADRRRRLEREVADALSSLQHPARTDPGRERLSLRLDARRPGDADVAADHVLRRALVHPARARTPAGRGDPRRRSGQPRVEEGDADHGRRADHPGAGRGHAAVVRPAQPAGLADAAGDRRLRRGRLRRRLPEDLQAQQEGPAGHASSWRSSW